MSTLKRSTLILTLIVLAACSAAATSPLAANRQKWESLHISHYRFILSISCFCGFNNRMPLTIEVKDGQLVSMLDRQGQPVTEFLDIFGKYSTIEKLFNVLDSALNGGADKVTVDYDAQYGYPQAIVIDYVENAMDDEMGFTINKFEILK
jgi:hypothetical protein